MIKLLRWTAAVLVISVALAGLYHVQFRRYRCNTTKAELQRTTAADWSSAGEFQASVRSRDRIAQLERCVAVSPLDVDLRMTLAMNYRIVNRLADAADEYADALRYDRRPEIFLNLGIVQLELGREDAAVDSLAHAVAFDASYAKYFDGEDLQKRVGLKAEQLKKAAAMR